MAKVGLSCGIHRLHRARTNVSLSPGSTAGTSYQNDAEVAHVVQQLLVRLPTLAR